MNEDIMNSRNHLSLDDRRPKRLGQIVGNSPVVDRLRRQFRNGRPPQRILFHGPTGAGKTTSARIVARYKFCLKPVGMGDPCDECANCSKELSGFLPYNEWTGNQVSDAWGWWRENMTPILSRPNNVVFIDEAQDLHKNHQAEFRNRLESAQAMVVFTTTHLHELDDALTARFGVNVYELKRPTTDEVVDHLAALCAELTVKAGRQQLGQVANHLGCDLRKCVDFVHTALDQTEGGLVTNDYVNMVMGLDLTTVLDQPAPPRRRSKF